PQHPVAATQQRPSPLVLQQQLQHQHQQLSHLTSEQLQQRRVAQVPPISTPTPQPPQQPLQPPQKQPSEPSEQPPQQQQQQRLPCFRGRLRLDSMLQSGPSSPYRDTPHRPQLTSPSQNCTAPAGNGSNHDGNRYGMGGNICGGGGGAAAAEAALVRGASREHVRNSG
ncbi:hypothetical protein Vretimale_3354, partial [Volvox reticuliferus]